jgi:hypothetical protein
MFLEAISGELPSKKRYFTAAAATFTGFYLLKKLRIV